MTSQEIKELIEAFIRENLDSENHFLVKVSVGSGKVKEGRVQVLIDSDLGITIDECAAYSRKLGKLLDVAPDQIHLEAEEKKKGRKAQLVPVAIPVQNIVKAKVTVSFK
jgi:ribosome maturation factor RimP